MRLSKGEKSYLENLIRLDPDTDFDVYVYHFKKKYRPKDHVLKYKKFRSSGYQRMLKYRIKQKMEHMEDDIKEMQNDLKLYKKVKKYLE